ncbi:MAG: hypothetical protein R3D58_06975 [Saprospiraceae bacterium]|nr:hypothetical protein [Lewinellaceae bacterium]
MTIEPGYCKTLHEWLESNPIRLKVVAGRVRKKELAYALNTTPTSLRYRIGVLCRKNEAFQEDYEQKASRMELPVDLAEMIVRLLFDNNPSVRIEFLPNPV